MDKKFIFHRRDAETQRKTYFIVSYAKGIANNKKLCVSAPTTIAPALFYLWPSCPNLWFNFFIVSP